MDADDALERQPGEPKAAHAAFLDFVYLAPQERSLRKLLRIYEERASRPGSSPPTTKYNTLATWSSKFHWTHRADLVDAEAARKKIAEHDKATAEMNKRHAQIAQVIQGKVLTWLKEPENVFKRPSDVIAAAKIAADMERRAMGVPEQILQLLSLPDAQIQARYTALLTQLRGGGVELPALEDGEGAVIEGEWSEEGAGDDEDG